MNDYYNYSNFNDNDESDKLDKLAREINNKKSKEKLQLIREVDNDFKKTEKIWENELQKALKENNNYMPKKVKENNYEGIELNENNLKSQEIYSDYDNNTPSSCNTYDTKSNKSYDVSTVLTNNTSINTDTYQNSFFNSSKNSSKNSSFIDSISIDSYIDEIKNNKNNSHYKLSEIIKNLDYDICSKNDDNIYDHVKKCNNCKKKLLRFLNKDILNNNDNKNNKKINKNKKRDKNNFIVKHNIKETIIMIMLGIFIIILLDLLVNRKK